MKDENLKSDAGAKPSNVAGHVHEWIHDDVEPTIPPVSVSTCSCGAIRRSWQDDEGEFREEIEYLT